MILVPNRQHQPPLGIRLVTPTTIIPQNVRLAPRIDNTRLTQVQTVIESQTATILPFFLRLTQTTKLFEHTASSMRGRQLNPVSRFHNSLCRYASTFSLQYMHTKLRMTRKILN
jgi:hypothetical protein